MRFSGSFKAIKELNNSKLNEHWNSLTFASVKSIDFAGELTPKDSGSIYPEKIKFLFLWSNCFERNEKIDYHYGNWSKITVNIPFVVLMCYYIGGLVQFVLIDCWNNRFLFYFIYWAIMQVMDNTVDSTTSIPQIPPNFHIETVGESQFVIPDRYSNLRPIGTGAQGYVV